MARIEYIRLRLNNWALWKAREAGGGLGFATRSSFLKTAGTDRYRESRIPIDEVDASLTDQAVESLKLARTHLYDTLQCIYPQGLGVRETARRLGIAHSSIAARLGDADHAINQWMLNRHESLRTRAKSVDACKPSS